MAKELSFTVPDALFEESATRLRAAGVDSPEELLEAVLAASAIDRLETIGGIGPVPTALSDVRSAWLFELCKARNEILSDEVVSVLFRIMPSTANSVIRRMQATYEAALHDSLSAHMIAMAKLTSPPKAANQAPLHRVTFATAAAFSHAQKMIAARGLTGEVSASPASRTLEFPQEVVVGSGSAKQKVRIARDVLGLP